MQKEKLSFSWNLLSGLIFLGFFTLQIARWMVLPQFMDIYYHILTAWGFVQAGGYSGWDFWQFAPVGRMHIYPPFFHLILALFIKLGVSKIILAKIFEAVTAPFFLFTLLYFMRKNFSERLGFFTLVAAASSLSFYMNLTNHVPATLAMIFGLFALDNLLQGKFWRTALILALTFYTHIGISWFLGLSIVIFGLLVKERRKFCLKAVFCALILSAPIIFKEAAGLGFIGSIGLNLNEKYLCQFKIIEYVLAIFGLILIFKMERKYRLFLGIFLASLIFLSYPYRFFSAEGYLGVIFLCGLGLEAAFTKLIAARNTLLKISSVLLVICVFFISPTVSMKKGTGPNGLEYKISALRNPFTSLLFPDWQSSIWFPNDFLPAVALIDRYSAEDEIIYSNLGLAGVILGGLSGRATANGLFPEIKPALKTDPMAVAKIIIVTKDEPSGFATFLEKRYQLKKIGETKVFTLYENPACRAKIAKRKAAVSFWMIALLGVGALFVLGKKI